MYFYKNIIRKKSSFILVLSNLNDWRIKNGKKKLSSRKTNKRRKIIFKKNCSDWKNKYIGKNYNYINSRNVSIDKIEISSGDSIVDEIIKMNEENMKSEEKLHEIFSDPKLYKIIKALSMKEKKVLFYFLMKYKTIKEVSNSMNRHKRTITKIRDNIFDKIADQLNRGGKSDVQ